MKKLLFLTLALCSLSLQATRSQFTVWTSPVVNKDIQELNLDVPRNTNHVVPAGVYRLATNDGPTNKYVKFPVDGLLRQHWADYTCFYVKNNENSYDKIACVDTKQTMHKNLVLNISGFSSKS